MLASPCCGPAEEQCDSTSWPLGREQISAVVVAWDKTLNPQLPQRQSRLVRET